MKNNIEKIKFRNAISTDAKQLSEIESEIFFMDKVNTNFELEIEKENKKIFVCTYENTLPIKKNILKKFFSKKNEKKFTQEEIIIGYIKLWDIMEDMHIEQIGVLENFQKKGIGEKLLKISINHSIQSGVKKIMLECRKSNIPAINLYKKYLFKITSIRKNYYPSNSGREDAICFESPIIKDNEFYKNLN
ncbi:MAG: ribosomal-protein-alanine N-acetyltransferase [Chloroflexi bacterium]|nr:ribosomal-protein-alanine N-acetyltransferase [Chloroflexota bacterium]|tara:strand:+ start:37 stop:606 length:570 start_codon:yes stop_codon:yes gene_type:complete